MTILNRRLNGFAFKQPIVYNKRVQTLDDSVLADLELTQLYSSLEKEEKENDDIKIENVEDELTNPKKNLKKNKNQKTKNKKNESDKPLYEYVFSPLHELGKESMVQLARHYTTDETYLTDFQNLVLKHADSKTQDSDSIDVQPMMDTWLDIKGETSFCEKYSYIQWDFVKHLNTNPIFMQMMSVYNIASPVISLCSPLLILIIPFFVLKLKQIPISLGEYWTILKALLSTNPLCKIFTQFSELDYGQKTYSLVSASFYLFTIYQNILSCVRFYINMQDIHEKLAIIRTYIDSTLLKMRCFSDRINALVSLTDFKRDFNKKILELMEWKQSMDSLVDFSCSIQVFKQFGHVLSKFYTIYESNHIAELVSYTFGFHGFMELLDGLESRVKDGQMHPAKFCNKNKMKTKFKKLYYPKFIDDINAVKNDCSLSKNMIITGPNGGGKTTMLKSVFINTLLSQQVGMGCFEHATISLYSQFHSYLNIPDTSARDSLFQAEVRRCKNILDKTKCDDNDDTHLCIFDELYSGTNPEEAIESATAFMKYMIQRPNVSCMLTTHYTQICENLKKHPRIVNMHMGIKPGDLVKNLFEYSFKLKKGISTVKGGLKVLKDMDYPDEITNSVV
jgi:hypothetical protein